MNPNETLRLFWNAVLKGLRSVAREHYFNLRDWLERGGFEPDWEAIPTIEARRKLKVLRESPSARYAFFQVDLRA